MELDALVGGRFWIRMALGLVGVAIIAMNVLFVAGAALLHWGLFGVVLLISVVAITFGWWYDRRQPPRLDRI
jgi:hypothetical protein